MEQAGKSCWRGAADVVAVVRVELRLPREQRGVLAPESSNSGGATPMRRLRLEAEHALHRQLMELRCRGDWGLEVRHGYRKY